MAVETEADLAGMFDPDEFGERARYTAPGGGGGPVPCQVIVDRGQGRSVFDAGAKDAAGSERKLWAQKSELAEISRGGLFEMVDEDDEPTGEAFTIAGLPKLDHTGRVWTCDLLMSG